MCTIIPHSLHNVTAKLRYDVFIKRFLAYQGLFGYRSLLAAILLVPDVSHFELTCFVCRRRKSTPYPTSCIHSYRSDHPEARGHLSEALTEDTGVGTSVAGSPLPLTTGNESLDITIVKHLQYCTQLIQVQLLFWVIFL